MVPMDDLVQDTTFSGEDWALEEDPSGQIAGTMTQTVTVFDQDGRVFGCSGDTFYRYRDRYTVSGQRRGDALTVREVAVAPEDHPCVRGASRHLDTATGAERSWAIPMTVSPMASATMRRPNLRPEPRIQSIDGDLPHRSRCDER